MSLSKVSNILPPAGGIVGALSDVIPNFISISHTIILAAIGAAVGYLVKVALDKIFKKG